MSLSSPFCPILKAGMMLSGIMLRDEGPTSYRESMNRFVSEDTAKCPQDESCMWFKKGCPAFPKEQ